MLTNNGTIDSFSNSDNIAGPGNVTVKAFGAGADINLGNQISAVSVGNGGSGLVDVEAGHDINLGNSAGGGVVRSFGAIKLAAGRDLNIDANGFVLAVGGGLTATAGRFLTMSTATGTITGAPFFQTHGGPITLATGAGGTLTLASKGTDAVLSGGGNITLSADAMSISQGVNAGAGNVLIQPVTAGELIGLGGGAGSLQLTNAALNLVDRL